MESLKEQYSKKISILINKDYKNIEDIMKSNSRIEALMKKFSYIKTDLKDVIPSLIFENLLCNNNDDFYEKCSKAIELVKSFLDIFSSMYVRN